MSDTWQSWQNRVLVGAMRLMTIRRKPIRSGHHGIRRTIEMSGKRLPPARDIRWTEFKIGDIPSEWVDAPNVRHDRAVLYLHGGGYVAGSRYSHRSLTGELSRAARMRVLAIDYRLAPEHPFPAGLDDAVAAYEWLLAQGLTPAQIAIGGDSAGGGLTMATLLALRERGLPQPAVAVCMSPWADLATEGESMRTHAHLDPMLHPPGFEMLARHYAGTHDLREPLVSPVYGDLSGLPPLLIQVGGREVLLDDARRLVARTLAAGGRAELEVWDHMIHVWQVFGFLPEARRAVARLGTFIRRHTD